MGGGCSGGLILPLSSRVTVPLPLDVPSFRSSEQYEILSTIGKGGYARVYCTQTRYVKSRYAMKKITFNRPEVQECEVDMAIAELNAYKRSGDSPFVAELAAAFYESGSCYLILDYYSGGDLRYHTKSLLITQESHIAFYISCIGSALHHLHTRGIIHRDIKPENILLTSSGLPKLADFGTAYVEEHLRIPICNLSSGTLPYMAPEMLTRNKIHSYHADFWELGIMTFEMLFNSRPFEKHCPKLFMYFVGNHYNYLWEKIQMSADEVGDVDFLLIDRALTDLERESHYQFPDHVVPLRSDGNVRAELLVPIPQKTYSGDLISSECLQFLRSTLDIRIPQRLGQLNHFELFSNHSWFQKHDCVIAPHTASLRSPYQPSSALVEHFLKTRFPTDPQSIESNKVAPCEDALAEDLEAKLQKFYRYDPTPRETTKISSMPSKKSLTSPYIPTQDELKPSK